MDQLVFITHPVPLDVDKQITLREDQRRFGLICIRATTVAVRTTYPPAVLQLEILEGS